MLVLGQHLRLPDEAGSQGTSSTRHQKTRTVSTNQINPGSLSLNLAYFCNGRALDRVTKSNHRPNRQKLSKKCPKFVFSAPPDNFWTFFRHFFDIFRTFCRHFLFLGCPTLCPLQAYLTAREDRQLRTIVSTMLQSSGVARGLLQGRPLQLPMGWGVGKELTKSWPTLEQLCVQNLARAISYYFSPTKVRSGKTDLVQLKRCFKQSPFCL